jgi:hypothetical protein
MFSKDSISRKKVVWAYSVVLKHLTWYINTSEFIPHGEKEPLLRSLRDALRHLTAAERIEKRVRNEPAGEFGAWAAELNERRVQDGRKPLGERRLLNELIRAILDR